LDGEKCFVEMVVAMEAEQLAAQRQIPLDHFNVARYCSLARETLRLMKN